MMRSHSLIRVADALGMRVADLLSRIR